MAPRKPSDARPAAQKGPGKLSSIIKQPIAELQSAVARVSTKSAMTGQGLTAKALQERLGHASIAMTLDVYSHLFPVEDEDERMAQAERSLLA